MPYYKCVYLQGEEFIVNGIKFWGGPWNPARGFTKRANGFSVSPRQSAKNWSKMPDDVDILVTHCPPYGVLDGKEKNQKVTYMGCPQLLDHVIRVSPLLHMFGHCHYEPVLPKPSLIIEMFLPQGCSTGKALVSIRGMRHR